MKKINSLLLALAFLVFSFSVAYAQNYALDFGGVSDFKFVMVGPDARFDTDGITIEAWIKPTSLPTGHYIYEGRSTIIWNGDYASGADPYIFYINEYGALEAYADFQGGGGEFIIDTTPVSLNEWHHVALTIDPSKMALYLDGTSVQELIHNRGPGVKNHSYVAIGRHLWYNNPFRGAMDEIRIWGVALTEQEIQNRMYAQLTGAESGLVAYWNFNEGSGQIVHDSTSNSIHGVLGLNNDIEVYDPSWFISDRPTAPIPEPIIIDIKPGSYPNSINLKSNGVVPVALLTTADFNASAVNPSTIKFAGASPLKWKMEDVDGDGDLDMLFHFSTQDLNLNGDSLEATLTGKTTGGIDFEGKDSVNIVPKGKGKK
jgi:hypothetical protein